MNTRTHMTGERVKRAKRWRFNPLRHLEPETLSRHLDSFEAGYLREAVNIWEHIEQRDDLLRAVISKRKKSVGRSGWTVLPGFGIPAGARELLQHRPGAERDRGDGVE
jgi:phage gp29-like protein